MSIPQAICPDCSAKLSSKTGFTAGQKIKCPKCETVFAVPAPKTTKPVVLDEEDEDRPLPKKKKPVVLEEDEYEPRPVKKKKPVIVEDDEEEEEDERPKKKKKKGKKSDEGGYASSPLRFVILGVLLVVMAVLGYFLVKKINTPPKEIVIPAKTGPGED